MLRPSRRPVRLQPAAGHGGYRNGGLAVSIALAAGLAVIAAGVCLPAPVARAGRCSCCSP
ncbi:MAG TPA: hypothetical protein VFO01_19800 [Trebonia sp.]|nr:hypothetical protein [Trebonia sp.]